MSLLLSSSQLLVQSFGTCAQNLAPGAPCNMYSCRIHYKFNFDNFCKAAQIKLIKRPVQGPICRTRTSASGDITVCDVALDIMIWYVPPCKVCTYQNMRCPIQKLGSLHVRFALWQHPQALVAFPRHFFMCISRPFQF
uniref:Putative secreted protein n=1 Tax=Ixodes ricinus TaxID=34613 RepID=A0A147BU94_IXORI